MITHVRNVEIFVSDQDKAIEFYVDKLGLEKRRDESMGPDASRWIEVAPKGAHTSIVLYKPTENMPGASTFGLARLLIGTFSTFVLEVDDLQKTYEELSARGVEFPDKPAKQYYGWWATVKDPDGNTIGLHQF